MARFLLPTPPPVCILGSMDPQRLNDLAERFALIIEGLLQAISAPQGRFGGWLFFLIPNRFRLLGRELAELAALIRSGKLFLLAPPRPRTAGLPEASSPPSFSDL